MKEIWMPIVGFDEYCVSNSGRIISKKRNKKTMLKPFKSGVGYFQVAIHVSGRCIKKYVHRLVLEAFSGPCPNGMECSHLDGDKTNNRFDNLAWESVIDNNLRKDDHLTNRKGESHARSKLTEGDVLNIRRLYASGNYSYRWLKDEFMVSKSNIESIVHRRSWKHI